MKLKVAFTGTRKGMTIEQKRTLRDLLDELNIKTDVREVHHGCCVGADEEFVDIVRDVEPFMTIVAHPPRVKTHVSQRALKLSDAFREDEDFVVRDKRMVEECDVLIAAPWQDARPKSLRGQGTWTTVNHAQKPHINRPTCIIYPNGRREGELS